MSSSDEDGRLGFAHRNRDQSTKASMARLASARLADVREDFNEEMHETMPRKRARRVSSERLTDSEDEEPVETKIRKNDKPSSVLPRSKGAELMAKMGYKEGTGLGKSEQGRTELIPLSKQRGRIGLGHESNLAIGRDFEQTWDASLEEKTVEESVSWISAPDSIRSNIFENLSTDWIVIGDRKETIDDEDRFCDGKLLRDMLAAKTMFETLEDRELREARNRANPYETIGSAFFQNRAAMKVANLDRVFDWIITKEDVNSLEKKHPTEMIRLSDGTSVPREGRNTDRNKPLFYFADVCAGPGGFTEYVLWRKGFCNAKGFGFTLRGKDDFKLERFQASAPEFFEPFYGKGKSRGKDGRGDGDGDVTVPQNIIDFEEVVRKGTDDVGVDLMMADGGFSVAGQENIQEILSKRIYLCQFLVALSVVRPETEAHSGGIFFCKLFDIFTPFSVGLVYLMYIAFKRISLHKPNTSRPANSERYIVCDELSEEGATLVKDYLTSVNNELDRIWKGHSGKGKPKEDINEIVPLDLIFSDKPFYEYLVDHNERLVKRQTLYLNKYRMFASNAGALDLDQGKLREECLSYWRIPDIPKPKRSDRNFQESAEAAFSRLCKTVPNIEALFRQRSQFNEGVVMNDHETRLRYAELRLCALSEREVPVILFSCKQGVFIRSDLRGGFEKLISAPPRIPRDTILFVQKTHVFSEIDERGRPAGKSAAIRILDAALINGDDLRGLPFDERMKAAKKMCKAVEMVVPPDAFCHVFTAEIYKLDELGSHASRFRVIRDKGEEVALVEEGDGRIFYCRGMRVVAILAEPWVMCWSRSQRQPYAFNRMEKGKSAFAAQFEDFHCCADFWKTVVPKQPRKDRPQENYQWFWDWKQNFLGENVYGPRQILEAEKHPDAPTWRSLYRIAQQQKNLICHS